MICKISKYREDRINSFSEAKKSIFHALNQYISSWCNKWGKPVESVSEWKNLVTNEVELVSISSEQNMIN